MWNYERVGLPRKEGGRYFFLRNDGLQNQSVLYWTPALDATPRVLIDPNLERADATVALARFEPSPDGRLVAYSLSDGGTDWEIWRFRRVDDGVDLPDELRFSKFWEFSWSRDGTRCLVQPLPATACRWRPAPPMRIRAATTRRSPPSTSIGWAKPQSADRQVYAVTDHPTRAPSARVTDDGRWLVVTLFDGYRTNGVDLVDLRRGGAKPQPLFAAWDALYTVIGNEGDTFYVQTTNGAPRGRVIAVDARRPAPRHWREVVPQDEAALAASSLVGGRIVAQYVRDAHGVARLFETRGRLVGEVPVPGLGTIGGFAGHADDAETFFTYTDYLTPTQVLRYDAAANVASDVPRAAARRPTTSRYVTRQVFLTSRDGTRVPMFVTHRRDFVARRQRTDAALRLRRLLDLADSGVQARGAGLAGDGRRLRGGQPARRRRVRRGLAPGGHARAQAERVRRLHRRRGIPGRAALHARRRGSRSPAAATAACWSARR